jgi:hypothetical protein
MYTGGPLCRLKPKQLQIVDEAIRAGLIETVADIVNVGADPPAA